ncbi:hypothetical protein Taro_001045 [Colocasia esculenta]|uniref:Uncharacterized protein n=1 Tax=Colocasia esculenta TaxID=4460 RepID=A0A843T8X1_COLES|nr:hypothetical protein [Colocasia esculenta]
MLNVDGASKEITNICSDSLTMVTSLHASVAPSWDCYRWWRIVLDFVQHYGVRESYSRGMDERYRDDSQRPKLDPDIWVAATGAPKKGHVYGFGHSLGTTRVISSCSSFVSHAPSPFTTPAAPGGSSSGAPTMTPAQFTEIVNETISQNISQTLILTPKGSHSWGFLLIEHLLHSNLR